MDKSNVVIRKGLLNTVGASGDNVLTDAASGAFPGQSLICLDNDTVPPVPVLPPIIKGTVKGAWKQASQAEVVQIAVIGRTAETIVASTRYKIEIYNGLKYESEQPSPFQYAYTSPAVLSGTAATDRENVYSALKTKINNHTANKVTAHLLRSVAFTTGTDNAGAIPAVGETVTQETSGVTAKIAAVVVTSGNFTGHNAAGTIYLYDFTDEASWSASSKTLTGGTSGAVVTSAAALTSGVGLAIVDDAGYYAPRPQSGRGKSYIALTQGFATATVEIGTATLAVGTTGLLIGRAGVYAIGIGSRMVYDTPVFTPDGVCIVSGEAWFQLNAVVDPAKTYTTFLFEIATNVMDTNIIPGSGAAASHFLVLYADESNGTNLGNLETTLETDLAIAIV